MYNKVYEHLAAKEIDTLIIADANLSTCIKTSNIIQTDKINIVDITDIISNRILKVWLEENSFEADHPCKQKPTRIWKQEVSVNNKNNISFWQEQHNVLNQNLDLKDEDKEILSVMLDPNIIHLIKKEMQVTIPQINLDKNTSRVLEISCGSGRWLRELDPKIHSYKGIDSNSNFIKNLQQKYKHNSNYSFDTLFLDKNTTIKYIINNNSEKYNIIIITALFIILDDSLIEHILSIISQLAEEKAQIFLQESVSVLNERLTLLNDYSHALGKNFTAVHRTSKEYYDLFKKHLSPLGFKLISSNMLYNSYKFLENNVRYFLWER